MKRPDLLNRLTSTVLALLMAVAGLPVLATETVTTAADESEELRPPSYLFRFQVPVTRHVSGDISSHQPAEHGHVELSADEMASRQADAANYLREVQNAGRPIDRAVFLELYRRAGHFSVIHALLGDVIDDGTSNRLGELRAELHRQVLHEMATSRKFGRRLGINDFGSGTMNAKSDIDFTPYADDPRYTGSELVAEYNRIFKSLSGGLDPGSFDLVAHQYEATIPDWRASGTVADFVQKLRAGTTLLKANPEAYFLEGAYAQQVMRRSAQGKTFTWLEAGAEGRINATHHNAAAETPFFYHPDARARYAWGAAVGNWHFFHAHASDRIAQAKYILRSLDDGVGLLARSSKIADFADMTFTERRALVRELYGDGPRSERYLAILETAAKIRQLKATGREAYAPLMELERRQAGGLEIDDDTAFRLAQDAFLRHGNQMLIENNRMAAENRLRDWLAPDIPEGKYNTIDDNGRTRTINIDADAITRLQHSAFFEMKDGLEVMERAQIEQIKRDNPRYARDIDILQRLIEKQRKMMFAPDDLDTEAAREYRTSLAEEVLADIHALPAVARQGGIRAVASHAANLAYKVEDLVQQRAIDGLAYKLSGSNPGVLKRVQDLRTATQKTNAEILDPKWMSRMDKANSVLEVAKTWVEEGELNRKVMERIFWEVFSFMPGGGTYMQLQSGVPGIITLVSTQLIPGYGPILITLTLVKNTVQLAGMAIFEPLQRERVLLAYQGYLPPAGGGWVTLSSGQTVEVRSAVPSILEPISGTDTADLDARREAIYNYFHRSVTEAIDRDPAFPYTEDEWPWEWAEQEQRWLQQRIRKHVLDWWNASGVFEGYDEILAFRSRLAGENEEVFQQELISRLWKDYYTGKTRSLQRKIQKNEESLGFLDSLYQQIASVFVGLGEIALKMAPDYVANAEAIMGYCLDGMPTTPPAMEILAAPRVIDLEPGDDSEEAIRAVPQIQFRARMWASEKDFPGPYTIRWEVKRGSETIDFDPDSADSLEAVVGESVGEDSASLTVVATAYDADGKTIISTSVPLTVEKVKIGEDIPEEEEAETGDDLTDEGGGADLGDLVDSMEGAAAAAAASAESARDDCAEAAEAARRTKEQVASMTPMLDGLAGSLEDLEARVAEAAELQTEADAALSRANGLARDIAELRDRAASLRDSACSDADAAESASAEERDRLVAEVRSAADEIDRIETEAADLLLSLRWEVEAIQRRVERYGALVAELDRMSDRLDTTAEATREIADQLEEARARVEEARAALTEVESRREQGAGIVAEAQGRIAGADETSEDHAALIAITDLQATIRTAEAAAAPCADETSSGELDPATEAADEIRATLDDLGSRLQTARQSLVQGGLGERLESMLAEATSLLELSEVFVDTIRNRARDARACADRAAATSAAPETVTMPNLVGQSETLAVAWLEDLGLNPLPQDAGPAPSSDTLDKVAAQSEAPNSSLAPGSTVVLFVYDEPLPTPDPDPTPLPAPSFTQATCDGKWPGTVLTRDPATGLDNCLCPGGTAWSRVQNTCLSLDGAPPPRTADCSHMPGTIRNPATGACRCPVGAWDPSQGRCVDTAAAAREREIGERRTAADCERLYSNIILYRKNPSAAYRAMAERAEAEARAMGCDAGRIAEASGTGGGGGGGDAPPTPVTGPVETEDEGEANVSSRHVNICIIDVNDILDDHYDLVINGAYIGSVANPEGGATCYGATLRSGRNDLILKLVATRGKSTYLKISINNDEYAAAFGGSSNHAWTVVAP